jgi:hypothetical protein
MGEPARPRRDDEGGEGFYTARSGRCPDLLVIGGGGGAVRRGGRGSH